MTPHPLETNLWAMHRDFARIPGASVHDDPDLLWYTVPGTNSWLNGASRCRLGDDADDRIRALVASGHRHGVPLTWHQTPTSQPHDLPERLAEHGFTPRGSPGMAMTVDGPLEKPPPELVVTVVSDRADVSEWTDTFDVAFGSEPRGAKHPWLTAFAALYLGETSQGRLFIGRVDGVAVGTALAFVGGGAVGLYGIGTVPEHRGRGYGGAMTVAGIAWGRERGANVAVLEASQSGLPVYERLGFRTFCEVTQWTRKRESAAD